MTRRPGGKKRRSPVGWVKPVTPGEILREEFLAPLGISPSRLAKEIFVPVRGIRAILSGRRALAADIDLRLCRLFGLSNGYWLAAQAAYDTEVAAAASSRILKRIKPWRRTPRADPFVSAAAREVLRRTEW